MAVNVLTSYPGNSHQETEAAEKVKAEKVTTGKVMMKKPSVGTKFLNTFFGSSTTDVKAWIKDNAILWVKNTILDGLSLMFFGRSYSNSYGRTPNVVGSLSGYRISSQPSAASPLTQQQANPIHFGRSYSDLRFVELKDAKTVLSNMVNCIECYGQVSVNDMYDYAGVTSHDFNSAYFGWTSLGQATIDQDRDGYWFLALPKPIRIATR